MRGSFEGKGVLREKGERASTEGGGDGGGRVSVPGLFGGGVPVCGMFLLCVAALASFFAGLCAL
jgi:hypothetical protein